MKKLRDIVESPWINPEIENKKISRPDSEIDYEDHKEISRMPSGHIVKVSADTRTYSVHDPKTGESQLRVWGRLFPTGNKYYVSNLDSHQGNTVKAHELYHHLITHHGIHLHSDHEQSEGGMKVWKRLQKYSDIHMQSYDPTKKTYSELKPSFQKDYDMNPRTVLTAKKR